MKISNFMRIIFGNGPVAPPSPGNRNNAPASPPVQVGNYQFIQPYYLYGADDEKSLSTTAPYHVPPAYRDFAAYALPEMDVSGLEGGGVAGDTSVPAPPVAGSLFYDPQTGLYYTMDAPE